MGPRYDRSVARIPTVLVAGDETLYLDLSEKLPSTVCRILYCETYGETLDRGAEATAVIVDERMRGGGEELCRRLRSDPLTASVPVILRASQNNSQYADYVVSFDLAPTLSALEHYCPDIAGVATPAPSKTENEAPTDSAGTPTPSPETSDKIVADDETFENEQNTVVARVPDNELHWPGPPEKGNDDKAYLREYAAYVSSLLDAFKKPESLSEQESIGLQQRSYKIVDGMDQTLSAAQKSVNNALLAKNLDLMRELSSAKNVLFEKLQQLRTVVNEVGVTLPKEPTVAPRPRRSTAEARAAALSASQKSRLTLEAEKRAKQKRADAKQAAAAAAPKASTTQRKQRATSSSSFLKQPGFWTLVVLLLAGGGVTYYIVQQKQAEKVAKINKSGNKPPVMKYVTVKESPSGVFARPDASDPENDQIRFRFSWYVNNERVRGANTNMLRPSLYKAGDSVQVEVLPRDGHSRGRPMRSQPLGIVGRDTPTPQRAQPSARRPG